MQSWKIGYSSLSSDFEDIHLEVKIGDAYSCISVSATQISDPTATWSWGASKDKKSGSRGNTSAKTPES